MTELIWVISASSTRVALAEEHEDHPGGLAWVAGDELAPEKALIPVQVARTGEVEMKLGQGAIKLVADPTLKPKRSRRRKAAPKKSEDELVADEVIPADTEA